MLVVLMGSGCSGSKKLTFPELEDVESVYGKLEWMQVHHIGETVIWQSNPNYVLLTRSGQPVMFMAGDSDFLELFAQGEHVGSFYFKNDKVAIMSMRPDKLGGKTVVVDKNFDGTPDMKIEGGQQMFYEPGYG